MCSGTVCVLLATGLQATCLPRSFFASCLFASYLLTTQLLFQSTCLLAACLLADCGLWFNVPCKCHFQLSSLFQLNSTAILIGKYNGQKLNNIDCNSPLSLIYLILFSSLPQSFRYLLGKCFNPGMTFF